tara:strand:+ start:1289 stop:1456 length:168 start_codon:yes stop_codon:yes gene_type:complete
LAFGLFLIFNLLEFIFQNGQYIPLLAIPKGDKALGVNIYLAEASDKDIHDFAHVD